MLPLFAFMILPAALVHAQGAPDSSPRFAGCYQVTSLTWTPDGSDIHLIPKEFELSNDSRGNGTFHLKSLGGETTRSEYFWWWEATGANKVRVAWGTGLGGIRGTLKRSSNGDLHGKIKEWCDSRCGWKRRTGQIRVQPIACTP